MSLPELDINYKLFLDRTTIIYGESGTGKTVLIVDVLYYLKPHIDQVIVISQTDRSNHTYDSGVVPLPLIHYTITSELLNNIWERQNALAAVYTKASNIKILQKLFSKIDSETAKSTVRGISRRLSDYKREVFREEDDEISAQEKYNKMKDECDKLLVLIYKHYINEYSSTLAKISLSSDEQFSLKYVNLNPRLVLIFDDVTDLLLKYKSHPVIQKLFYQGRWAYITALISCHSDKVVSPELKKNSFVNFYTEESAANAYFGRKSNDLDKDAKARAMAAIKAAFSPLDKHQKLVYIREEKKFYRYKATKRPGFKFGSPALWKYCEQVKSLPGSVNLDNKFMHEFMN
jgi:hypothetical protein